MSTITKLCFPFILGLLLQVGAPGTPQMPDRIVYEGKEYPIYEFVMRPYFRKHPEKEPQPEVDFTALYRGYVTSLEVKDKKLLLKDIEIVANSPTSLLKSVMNEVVPKGEVLPIYWFTGTLELPCGEPEGHSFFRTHTNYILLQFKQGKLLSERKVNRKEYEQFLEQQYKTRKTEDFSAMLSRPPLEGEPLPDLGSVNLPANAIPKGKAALVCLFDVEQRSSRQMLRLLGEQQEYLKQKGVSILGVQSVVSSPDVLTDWQKNNPVPFAVGRVAERTASTRWAAEIETLPWLILVNKEGLVKAEGFSIDELDARIDQVTK